jgi:hypothetical protein
MNRAQGAGKGEDIDPLIEEALRALLLALGFESAADAVRIGVQGRSTKFKASCSDQGASRDGSNGSSCTRDSTYDRLMQHPVNKAGAAYTRLSSQA